MLDQELENQIIMLIKKHAHHQFEHNRPGLDYLQWQELCQQLYETITKFKRI